MSYVEPHLQHGLHTAGPYTTDLAEVTWLITTQYSGHLSWSLQQDTQGLLVVAEPGQRRTPGARQRPAWVLGPAAAGRAQLAIEPDVVVVQLSGTGTPAVLAAIGVNPAVLEQQPLSVPPAPEGWQVELSASVSAPTVNRALETWLRNTGRGDLTATTCPTGGTGNSDLRVDLGGGLYSTVSAFDQLSGDFDTSARFERYIRDLAARLTGL